MPPEDVATLGDLLLDAQVAFHLDRLTGDELEATVTRLAGWALEVSGQHQLADLVDAAAVKEVVGRALTQVPSSPAVSAFIDLAIELVQAGPPTPFPLSDVVEREHVERVLDEALGLTPVLERGLERLTASPLVGATATRFMGRVVGEALAANQAVADKVPGLGSLLSMGTKAAAGVVGAADRQLDGLLADTAGKGGTLAVRRLNRIIVDTLNDATTREAALQVWDLVAAEPVRGLGDRAGREELSGVVDATHDLVVAVLAHPHVVAFGHAAVDGFFEAFGGYTPLELLEQLELEPADLVADAVRFAPGVVEALVESGELEQLLRAELAPFYASDAVAQLLAGRD
ncbi:hypothetical protein [Aeromicrobium fastidiosum]|uniref:hypothetical protein n=1 Tax=Aeromicrobium fastidiosum TaxID=52699 RepID=UPI00165F64DA|nr:hypothetical protein [Aeromicrobium fastidiosum]MBP2391419.1 hypothetical protein [Aeromicrobium fastidiosum]